MKNTVYIIWFTRGRFVRMLAGSANDAAILAVAEQIKLGNDTFISSIENDETGEVIINHARVLLEEVEEENFVD